MPRGGTFSIATMCEQSRLVARPTDSVEDVARPLTACSGSGLYTRFMVMAPMVRGL